MPELTDIAYVRSLLDQHGFRFSKGLGQNFLINPSVCPRMAEACGAGPDSAVMEIGAGMGVLTRELCRRAGRVLCIELDRRLEPVLAQTLGGCDNLEILWADAMKLDLAAAIRERFAGMRVAVCANLPYYITSPLIMRLLESRLPLDNITVMVQKEAAARLCAAPGTRESGAVTLAVHYYAKPQTLFGVSRGSFLPAPHVDSAVIRLAVRQQPPCEVRDERLMFRLIRTAFEQRRKTLPNALGGLGTDKAAVAAALEAAGLSPLARAEQLTLADWASLTERWLSTQN